MIECLLQERQYNRKKILKDWQRSRGKSNRTWFAVGYGKEENQRTLFLPEGAGRRLRTLAET